MKNIVRSLEVEGCDKPARGLTRERIGVIAIQELCKVVTDLEAVPGLFEERLGGILRLANSSDPHQAEKEETWPEYYIGMRHLCNRLKILRDELLSILDRVE